MLISHTWLQEYFGEEIPSAEKIADLFTFHTCEVEEIKPVTLSDGTKDTVIDLKILPDRAHYALSYQGVAYELAALLGHRCRFRVEYNQFAVKGHCPSVLVESKLVRRYMARKIENISVTKSTQDIINKLETIGQRPINSIVDYMNFVMFDVGQPLHAFDADLVKGAITIRQAHEGEMITTLDNKEVKLGSHMVIIADDAGPLAIAGVKGGKRAEVTEKTKNIIIESANFAPVSVRQTSTQLGIRTDASKRFENDLSADTATMAMDYVTHLIHTANPESVVGEVVDLYPHAETPVTIQTTPEEISNMLGVTISKEEIQTILERLLIGVEYEGEATLTLTVPNFRKDLRIPADIAEEVGRLYGYDKIPATPLPQPSHKEEVVPSYFYEQKIRKILEDNGFSEVYTPTIVDEGDVEIMNPLASDKKALRPSLTPGLKKALDINIYNATLLGLETVKIFEIGKVFNKEVERTVLGIAIFDTKSKGKKSASMLTESLDMLGKNFNIELKLYTAIDNNIAHIALDEIIEKLPTPEKYETYEMAKDVSYISISQYPFTSRDIAVFVPESVSQNELQKIIVEKAGPLMVRDTLFDVFKKEGKVSYAFRLVFQSHERTLTDDEINKIMEAITATLSEKGWQVR